MRKPKPETLPLPAAWDIPRIFCNLGAIGPTLDLRGLMSEEAESVTRQILKIEFPRIADDHKFYDFSRSVRIIARQESVSPRAVVEDLRHGFVAPLFEVHDLPFMPSQGIVPVFTRATLKETAKSLEDFITGIQKTAAERSLQGITPS